MTPITISFIILNYQSEQYLANCISSIKKHLVGISHEIIIVNNDPAPIKTIQPTENIHFLNQPNNAGFSSACNKGAEIATGDILFFLNPDTEIKTGGIADLISALEDPTVGIVSPRLILLSGETQPWSIGYEITLWDIIMNNFGFMKSKQLWSKHTSVQADWVSGAAFAIKKDVFTTVSGFDENFFMYFEDVDLCKRVASLGKKIILSPSVKILHIGGQSFSDNEKQKELYYISQDYYFKKHFGVSQLFLLKLLRSVSTIFKNKLSQ